MSEEIVKTNWWLVVNGLIIIAIFLFVCVLGAVELMKWWKL